MLQRREPAVGQCIDACAQASELDGGGRGVHTCRIGLGSPPLEPE
jgi:hypothetical protein